MTAWGEVAVCAAGGLGLGPLLGAAARRRPAVVAGLPEAAVAAGPPGAAVAPAVGAASTAGTLGDAGDGRSETPDPDVAPRLLSPGGLVVTGVLTAAACALGAIRMGAVPALAAYCVLFAGLAAISVADLDSGLVPRRILYPTAALAAAALVAASAADHGWPSLLHALIGAAGSFVVFGGIWWLHPKGLGFGDVRLAALCGGALGWIGFAPLYLGFLAAFVAGVLSGLAVLAVRGRRRFPFAPALALGTVFGVLWGVWLGNLWLHPG